MNKVICILLSVMLFGATSFAQTNTSAAPKTKKGAMKMQEQKAEKPTKMKKDGTPDMRYSENKNKKADKPAGPMKKDGTPDMRHKANKEAAANKK